MWIQNLASSEVTYVINVLVQFGEIPVVVVVLFDCNLHGDVQLLAKLSFYKTFKK